MHPLIPSLNNLGTLAGPRSLLQARYRGPHPPTHLLQLLGGAPCLAIVGLTLAPISDGISLASLLQLAGRSIDWRLQGEGTPRLVPNSATIGLTVRDSLEPGQG